MNYYHKKNVFLWILFLFTFLDIYAQKLISDSLSNAFKSDYKSNCFNLFEKFYQETAKKDTILVQNFLSEILKDFEKKNFLQGVCNVYIAFSNTYNENTHYLKVLSCLDKASKIAQKENLLKEKMVILLKKGLYYSYQLYSPEKGLPFILEGINLSEKNKLKKESCEFRQRLILILYQGQQYDKTRQYCLQSLNECGKQLSKRDLISLYNTIGLTYQRQKKIVEAKEYFSKTIALAKKYKDVVWIGIANGNLGTCFDLEENYEKAIELYEVDIKYGIKNKEWSSTFFAANRLLVCYKRLRNEAKVKETMALIDLIRKQKFPYNLKHKLAESEAFLDYSLLNKDIDDAWKYKNNVKKYQDSIQEIKKTEQIEKILVANQVHQKEEKIKALEINEKHSTERNAQKNFYILLLISVLFFLATFSLFFYILYRKNKKLTQDLYIQNRQIESQAEELRKSNFAKDKLFSIISHDFRNPLANLGSLLKLFNDGHISEEELKHFAKDFQSRAETTLVFIDNLLFWAKNQMQGLEYTPKKCNLKQTLNETIYLLTTQFQNKQLQIINHIEEDAFLWVDEDMLQLIVRNLLTNAAKFSFQKGIITIDKQEKDDFIFCSIKDEGVGMTKEQQEKLFKYDTFNSTTGTNQEKGTGLGLILSYDFIKINQGKLTFESEINKGTTFYFSLPKYNVLLHQE